MSKAVSRGQALQVAARVGTQVNWDELDGDCLQREVLDLSSQEFGRRFTAFIKNGARFGSGSNIIHIDHSQPFNPVTFIGDGWTIEEQDERSLAFTELNLIQIRFETNLEEGETRVRGEEKLRRLKAMKVIRLDAKVAQTLYENPSQIPEEWKKSNTVYFDGTILCSPHGRRCITCLNFSASGECSWGYCWLGNDLFIHNKSAVLDLDAA